MKRLFTVLAVSILVALEVTTGAAGAGIPADQACVGESLSGLATDQLEPGGFGAGVVGFAQDPNTLPGLGDGIQALAAGQVPDEVVLNTCNP